MYTNEIKLAKIVQMVADKCNISYEDAMKQLTTFFSDILEKVNNKCIS